MLGLYSARRGPGGADPCSVDRLGPRGDETCKTTLLLVITTLFLGPASHIQSGLNAHHGGFRSPVRRRTPASASPRGRVRGQMVPISQASFFNQIKLKAVAFWTKGAGNSSHRTEGHRTETTGNRMAPRGNMTHARRKAEGNKTVKSGNKPAMLGSRTETSESRTETTGSRTETSESRTAPLASTMAP